MTTIQQKPRQAASNIAQFVDEVDRAALADERRMPVQELTPPAYGSTHRKHIETCVDGIVQDLCSQIDQLRRQLKTIEDALLQSAAKSKHSLNEHVTMCVKLHDEILHTQDVIDELKAVAAEV